MLAVPYLPPLYARNRRVRGLGPSALLWLGLGALFLFGLVFCAVGTTATFMSIESSWQGEAQGGEAQPTVRSFASGMYSPRLQDTRALWHHGDDGLGEGRFG